MIRLTKLQLKHLHISALEVLTILTNFLIFGPMLALLDTAALDNMPMLVQCDSLMSTKIMTGRRRGTTIRSAAKSPLMQCIHQQMTTHPQYKRLEKCVEIAHEWGEGNILSDARSRGREDKLISICNLLGISAKKIEVSNKVTKMTEGAVQFAIANPRSNDKQQGKDQNGQCCRLEQPG